MKKFLLTLTLAIAGLMAAAPFASAQDREGRPRMNLEERLAKMKESLSLTDEQTAKLKESMEKTQGKMRELRTDSALSDDDRRAKMGEMRKAQQEEWKEILTPEQLEKLKEMRKENRRDAKKPE
jgi:Spy/CpxP family protein refolding chaperone